MVSEGRHPTQSTRVYKNHPFLFTQHTPLYKKLKNWIPKGTSGWPCKFTPLYIWEPWCKQYKRILEPKRRKIIVHKTKDQRSTRYLYDPKICEFCDYPMSLYERDHLMCHCSAFKTNPCSKKGRLNLSDEIFIARHFELAKLKYNKLAAENIRVP